MEAQTPMYLREANRAKEDCCGALRGLKMRKKTTKTTHSGRRGKKRIKLAEQRESRYFVGVNASGHAHNPHHSQRGVRNQGHPLALPREWWGKTGGINYSK